MSKTKNLTLEFCKNVSDIDIVSTIANRGISQSKFLLNLVKNDIFLLILLEIAISELHYFGCPSTQDEISDLINKYYGKNPSLFEMWLNRISDASILNGFRFDISSYEKLLNYHIQYREYSANCIEKEIQFITMNKWKYKFATKRKLVIGGMGTKKESDPLIYQTYENLLHKHNFTK
jgi:hypothetical protein